MSSDGNGPSRADKFNQNWKKIMKINYNYINYSWARPQTESLTKYTATWQDQPKKLW